MLFVLLFSYAFLKQNYGVGEKEIGITFEPHMIGQHITTHNVRLEALYTHCIK
jgi:hypothetical protein